MIGIKEFKIEKPEYQRSYFLTSIIKYFVLAFVSWMCCIVLALFIIGHLTSDADNQFELVFKYAIIIGSLYVFYLWFRYFLKKYRLSSIYHIIIDYDKEIVTFHSINQHTGKELEKEITFANYSLKAKFDTHFLFGEQTILAFYDNDKLYNVLNIDLTAWNRLEYIEEIIDTLILIEN